MSDKVFEAIVIGLQTDMKHVLGHVTNIWNHLNTQAGRVTELERLNSEKEGEEVAANRISDRWKSIATNVGLILVSCGVTYWLTNL